MDDYDTIEHIRAAKLRALAVTVPMRLEALPSGPIMSEFVPGHEASTWSEIGAPRRTPAPIVDKLDKEINAGLAAESAREINNAPLLSALSEALVEFAMRRRP
jgi:tripartite-type tricarboxylate transporter receptor subunit TctC